MNRIIILVVSLAALLIPAAASARTPVSGGLKQTITQAFTEAQSTHIDPTMHQISACFDVYTDGSLAYVTINPARSFRPGTVCDIKAHFLGQVSDWQPVQGLLRHETSSGGYWRVLLTFDQIGLSQLKNLAIPLAVFENLAGTKPPNYPFVP
jgi:hypothetical protein